MSNFSSHAKNARTEGAGDRFNHPDFHALCSLPVLTTNHRTFGMPNRDPWLKHVCSIPGYCQYAYKVVAAVKSQSLADVPSVL